jgi:hypothetical protein
LVILLDGQVVVCGAARPAEQGKKVADAWLGFRLPETRFFKDSSFIGAAFTACSITGRGATFTAQSAAQPGEQHPEKQKSPHAVSVAGIFLMWR